MKNCWVALIICTLVQALQISRPGAQWKLDGTDYSGLEWLDIVQSKPTRIEVDNALNLCKSIEIQEKQARDQAKIDLNAKVKTDREKIEAIIRYLGLDK